MILALFASLLLALPAGAPPPDDSAAEAAKPTQGNGATLDEQVEEVAEATAEAAEETAEEAAEAVEDQVCRRRHEYDE